VSEAPICYRYSNLLYIFRLLPCAPKVAEDANADLESSVTIGPAYLFGLLR
jgi:hypothetical protein